MNLNTVGGDTICAVLKPVGVAVGVLGAVFGITGLGVVWLIDDSVH